MVNNGTLAFHRSGTVSFAPSVSGSGDVNQMGPGVLALTSPALTYTGPTLVSGGTLQVTGAVMVHLTMDGTLGAIAKGDTIPDSSGNGNNFLMWDNGGSYVAGHFGQGIPSNGSTFLYSASPLPQLPRGPLLWVNIPSPSAGVTGLVSGRWGSNGYGSILFYNPGEGGFETDRGR